MLDVSRVSEDEESRCKPCEVDIRNDLSFFSSEQRLSMDNGYPQLFDQKKLIDAALSEETTSNYCYALSINWYKHWVEFVAGARPDSPGPIDNRELINSDGRFYE